MTSDVTNDLIIFSDAPEHLRPFWDSFFLELKEGMSEIQTAWEQKNLKTLKERAHCYKGQVMLFRYYGFQQRFLLLEHYTISKDMDNIEHTITELQNYFQQEVHRYVTYKNCHC